MSDSSSQALKTEVSKSLCSPAQLSKEPSSSLSSFARQPSVPLDFHFQPKPEAGDWA